MKERTKEARKHQKNMINQPTKFVGKRIMLSLIVGIGLTIPINQKTCHVL